MPMNLYCLRVGDKLRLYSGAIALVEAPTEDGAWIPVRYLASPDDPGLVGTRGLCGAGEIRGIFSPGIPHPWVRWSRFLRKL